jgi:hypothetical protein
MAFRRARKRQRLELRVATMRIWPGRGLGFWASVARQMKVRRISPRDRERVERLCAELEGVRPAQPWRGPREETLQRGSE